MFDIHRMGPPPVMFYLSHRSLRDGNAYIAAFNRRRGPGSRPSIHNEQLCHMYTRRSDRRTNGRNGPVAMATVNRHKLPVIAARHEDGGRSHACRCHLDAACSVRGCVVIVCQRRQLGPCTGTATVDRATTTSSRSNDRDGTPIAYRRSAACDCTPSN
jgi:hypothetical protein